MADRVWAWCDKTGARGRTVTVKIKWADFAQSTRCRTMAAPIGTRDELARTSVDLLCAVLPLPKGVRLVGVALSHFLQQPGPEDEGELPFDQAGEASR